MDRRRFLKFLGIAPVAAKSLGSVAQAATVTHKAPLRALEAHAITNTATYQTYTMTFGRQWDGCTGFLKIARPQ